MSSLRFSENKTAAKVCPLPREHQTKRTRIKVKAVENPGFTASHHIIILALQNHQAVQAVEKHLFDPKIWIQGQSRTSISTISSENENIGILSV